MRGQVDCAGVLESLPGAPNCIVPSEAVKLKLYWRLRKCVVAGNVNYPLGRLQAVRQKSLGKPRTSVYNLVRSCVSMEQQRSGYMHISN